MQEIHQVMVDLSWALLLDPVACSPLSVLVLTSQHNKLAEVFASLVKTLLLPVYTTWTKGNHRIVFAC